MDTREQRNERVENLGRPGMPMVWIVLVVIGMILLVGWLALGQFGPPAGDGVADPMTPAPATAPDETETAPPSEPLPDRDPTTLPPP
jgi:hypothetical protein